MVDISVEDIEGYVAGADAYVYVIELCRVGDNSTWYYVGQTVGGENRLRKRLMQHAASYVNERCVFQNGEDILKVTTTGMKSIYAANEEYRVVRIDRVEPVFFECDEFDNPLSYEPNDDHWVAIEKAHRSGLVDNVERRISYETALRYDTTNVLGGK